MRSHGIQEHQFPNGFKIIIKEDHQIPIAVFQMWYKVGSSFEHDGITGISHFLEHMMFRGTHHDNSQKFLKKITNYGGQHNAYTGHDYTTYFEIIKAENIEICLQFESDRMLNLALHDTDFIKEKEIILNERRSVIEDNPQRLSLEHFSAIANVLNPYRHPIIGWAHDLKKISPSDIKKWYRLWYTPNNAIGVIVGDVNTQKILPLIEKYFAHLPSQSTPESYTAPSIFNFGARSTVVKSTTYLPYIILGFNVPVVKTAKIKWEPYALFLLNGILGGSNSARLQQKLIKEKKIANAIKPHYTPFTRLDSVLYFLITGSHEHKLDDIKEAVLHEINIIKNEIPNEKEISKIKAQTIAHRIYQEDSIANQAHTIGSLESVELSCQSIDKFYKYMNSITDEQIVEVAKKYLNEENMTLTYLVPNSKY